jgi:hypothetical protein
LLEEALVADFHFLEVVVELVEQAVAWLTEVQVDPVEDPIFQEY